ncbi:hypothetical protein L798_10433 [Zootermopsis nevadensis]|uniref:Uncharacterized protein n=1 Tax=Zootermopsis nevadensis TaxID=136037 RepID=A0A067R8B9_ZOONE|nr:hypothetical protein L798_10433 [Zootermopsis nevadensis]
MMFFRQFYHSCDCFRLHWKTVSWITIRGVKVQFIYLRVPEAWV